MVRGMIEDDNDTRWWEGTVLTRISPGDVVAAVFFAVLWPPMTVMFRTGEWIHERLKK